MFKIYQAKPDKMKGKIEKSITAVGGFNTPLLFIQRIGRQKSVGI